MSNIEMGNAQIADRTPPESQPLAIVERYVGNTHVTLIGVEHEVSPQSYPWQSIRRYIEHLGEQGAVALEYFPSELEQTIYRHVLLGWYARRYAAHAGITHFFGGVGHIAAHTQHEIIVLDPANTAAFQMLYLHLPLAAIAMGTSWWCYEVLHTMNGSIQRRGRSKLLQRLLAATLLTTGLGGVAWFAQDTPYRRFLQPLYRDYAVHMRDMRWVTIAQGLAQYCQQHEHRVVVLYPPAHLLDGITHYLDHPEQRKRKYRLYAKFLPGITKAIRAYRWDGDQWRLVKYERIVSDT
jgi:hypothetical protein